MIQLTMSRFSRLFAALIFVSGAAWSDPSLPWTLRNHYSIPIEQGVLIYAEDNAEWRVLMADGTVLADSIGFSITLSDGTELNGLNLGEGAPSRDAFSHELGDGTTYSVTFPAHNGLKVAHVLRTFKARPFVYIEISVENVGTTDVSIASIRPVVAKTSVMQSLSPQTRIRYRSVQDVGGHPVLVSEENATMAVIHDPAKPICFGIGMLPQGQARSTVNFREREGEWHGDIVCHYEPAKRLAPGDSLDADPLWISHGVPEAHRVDLYYSWAYSMYVDPPEKGFTARGWYTLDDTQGLDAYISAGTAWKGVGIDHVLLASGWEGRPGSFQGAASRFPKNMKSAADALTQAGLQMGVTIDPLIAGEGGQEWTTESSDGQSWINPQSPGSVAALTSKITELKSWGATFVVVGRSLIPDAALETFGLTRAEAQNAAYKMLRDAAAPIPVFPASESSVAGDVDSWLDASSSVARMAIYGVIPGPLPCRVGDVADLSDDMSTAASLWPGPIEFQGLLGRKQSEGLSSLVARQRVPGQPMDADVRSPRTWHVQDYDSAGNLLGERTISVGSAPAVHASTETTSQTDGAAS